jgi:hypothetical protein
VVKKVIAVAVAFVWTSGHMTGGKPGSSAETPGQALERLGARVGPSALAVWPRVTLGTKRRQGRNPYTYVVIGSGWKGGVEGLKYLKEQRDVRGVMFSHPASSDEWCICLSGMTNLKEVYVFGERFTDKGLKSLNNLKALEALSLLGTRVSDDGLACLEDKRKLRWLSLAAADVTDAGMAHLRHAHDLRWLNLDATEVDGKALAHLKGATKMEWLRLSGLLVVRPNGPDPRLLKAGLQHLRAMKRLRYLSIGGMQATEAEMKRLLDEIRGLKGIEMSDGVFTRGGWKEGPTIQQKLNRIGRRLLDNSKQ